MCAASNEKYQLLEVVKEEKKVEVTESECVEKIK